MSLIGRPRTAASPIQGTSSFHSTIHVSSTRYTANSATSRPPPREEDPFVGGSTLSSSCTPLRIARDAHQLLPLQRVLPGLAAHGDPAGLGEGVDVGLPS